MDNEQAVEIDNWDINTLSREDYEQWKSDWLNPVVTRSVKEIQGDIRECIGNCRITDSIGVMFQLPTLGQSYSSSPQREKLLSLVAHLTEAHYQLRSYLATNEFDSSQPLYKLGTRSVIGLQMSIKIVSLLIQANELIDLITRV